MAERIVLTISREDGPFTFRVPILTIKISNETIVDSQVKKRKLKKKFTSSTRSNCLSKIIYKI